MTDYGELQTEVNSGKLIPLEINTPLRIGYCNNCHGAKYVYAYQIESGPYQVSSAKGSKYLNLPNGAGWYTGEMKITACPACSPGLRSEWLKRNCGLSAPDMLINLSDFLASGTAGGKKQARDMIYSLLRRGRYASGYITLWGDYGVGKTFLLKAAINGFRVSGVQSRYITAADLLGDIRERFGGGGDGVVEVERMIDAYGMLVPILAIDEVDRINLTPWARETLFRLLDTRYNNAATMLTILALNPNPQLLGDDWGYLKSRMGGGEIIEVGGPDMRPATKTDYTDV